ncbi:hypothetical protein LOTGIDRAFT_174035 [Lottia gigantea]|uniref:Kringle domain-containing protein n=1 Tax=Lottia gigantea TaxID=225164 RepID=V4CB24_LOTGI|nr:hypothetical protein LOTGIDRAFT_174035 [Lottia gigantea]ESO99034.1 hypothetical protein LOTGIDRAFT_174035 [Lottia gigantea]
MLTVIPELIVSGSIVNYTCQFNRSITLTAVCDSKIQSGARGPVIIRLVSSQDQSNTTHIIGTCGGIFEDLNDNETIFIECSSPTYYGFVINVGMVLEPGVTGFITVWDDLIPMQAYDVQNSYAFDQSMDTCQKLESGNMEIMGADAKNRTFIVLSVTIMLLDHECYRSHPSNYQGKMNFTWNDTSCERWDQIPTNLNFNMENLPDDSVKDAENYCRNPDNSASVPWCFVKNYTDRENCMVQKCSLFCSLSPDGTDYGGMQTQTPSKQSCVYWSDIEDTNKVQEYKKNFNTRRCRNYGDSFSSPWCFTNVSGQSFSACSMIHCAKTINTIQVSKPSMLAHSLYHPYCYWNRNTYDTNNAFIERFEMNVNTYSLQTRCLDGVNSMFCYGESDRILTHYHVDNCDTDTTTHSPTTELPFTLNFSKEANLKGVLSQTVSFNFTERVFVNGSNIILQSVSNLTKIKLPNLTDLPVDLPDELCNCLCVESQILDDVTLDKRIEDIVVSLSIEKSNLTRVMRRKISINDERPSVLYIGSGAVAIFSIFILLVISPDIIYLVNSFSGLIKNCRKNQHP